MDKTIKHFFFIFSVILFTSTSAIAENLSAAFSFDTTHTVGELAQGTMSIQLMNNTSADINNVYIRLAASAPSSIVRQTIQLGQIKVGETRIGSDDATFEQALLVQSDAVPIQVDYDDTQGNRQSITISAIKAN